MAVIIDLKCYMYILSNEVPSPKKIAIYIKTFNLDCILLTTYRLEIPLSIFKKYVQLFIKFKKNKICFCLAQSLQKQ